jgi:ABC-type bacteriocin/lantibiotic exporter with double-glycine peptidase domain
MLFKVCVLLFSVIAPLAISELLLTIGAIPQFSVEEPAKNYESIGNLCGVFALYYALKDHGVDMSLEEIANLSHFDEMGTTFLGLKGSLEDAGLDAHVYQLTPEGLLALTSPAILMTESSSGYHYVYLREVYEEQLHIFDYPKFPRWESVQEFADVWTGYALVINPHESVVMNYCWIRVVLFVLPMLAVFAYVRSRRRKQRPRVLE